MAIRDAVLVAGETDAATRAAEALEPVTAVRRAPDPDGALEALREGAVGGVVAGPTVGGVTGAEFAALVTDTATAPVVVVGEGVPTEAARAAGAARVLDADAAADPDRLVAALTGADGREPARQTDDRRVLEELQRVAADSDRPLEERIEFALALGREYLDTSAGVLTRIEDGTQTVQHAVGSPTGLTSGETAPLNEAYCRRTLAAEEETLAVADTTTAWPDDPAHERFGLGSYVGTTVRVRGETYGTLCFADPEPRGEPFDRRRRTFVELLAQWVGYELTAHEQARAIDDRDRALRERGQLLETVGDHVGEVIWVTTPGKDEMEFVSAAYEEVWGRPREQLYERPLSFVEAVHREDRDRVRAAIEAQQTDPDGYEETYRVVQPDGEVRWVEDTAFGVYEDGDLVRIVGVASDVTDRRERERDLELVETVFEEVQDAVFLVDVERPAPTSPPTFRVERVNPAYERATGLDAADIEGQTPRDLLGPETGAAVERRYRECLRAGEPVEYEETLPLGEDARVWQTRLAPVTEEGRVRKLVGATRNVTERKQREQKLREQRAFTESLLDGLHDVFYAVDEDGQFIRWNDRLEAVTGYDADQLAEMQPVDLVPASDRDRVWAAIDDVADGAVRTVESALVTADGEAVPYEFTGAPVERDGEVVGLTGVGRRQAEPERRREVG